MKGTPFMRVFRDLTFSDKKTAVALGYFDGIHLGHKAVLQKALDAKNRGLAPAAFTFSSTPKSKDKNSQLLTYGEKLNMLEKFGIEELYILDFEKLKDYSPEDFVKKIIAEVFNAEEVFCGFNYRFGKLGAGNTDELKKLCAKENIKLGICEPVKLDGDLVCSTEIRNALKNGDIKKANRFLGYDFGLKSEVLKGKRIGSKIDTPTINQKFENGIILPKFGVYASIVTIDKETFIGVTNIGIKPTVGSRNLPNCETYMPEYKGSDLYGKTVDVRLKEFIRPERKFHSLDELKKEIINNSKTAIKILSK